MSFFNNRIGLGSEKTTIQSSLASISLAMVVQYNYCNQKFFTGHRFSMGLRSGEFPGQSNTFNFCYLKTVFTFLVERHGE